MKKFTRTTENFTCEHCGVEVSGDGYTNHCPNCLWSKHVDVNPGDRANSCLGMMEPISLRKKDRNFDILLRCVKCKFEKWNRVTPSDNSDIILKLSIN